MMNNPIIEKSIPICIGVLFFWLLQNISAVGIFISTLCRLCLPVIIGCVIAYVFDPFVTIVQKYISKIIKNPHRARNISIAVIFIVFFLSFSLLMYAMIPQLITSALSFSENLPEYKKQLVALISTFNTEKRKIDVTQIENKIETFSNTLLQFLSANLTKAETPTTIGEKLGNTGIAFIISVYLLASKTEILKVMGKIARKIINKSKYPRIRVFCENCNRIMVKFIGIDLLDGLIIGVANSVFMAITGMPYNVLVSVIVGVTNLIPTFGPMIGAVAGAFILILADPVKAIQFLVFTAVLQTIDGYVLKPKLFGNTLGVPSAWVLISIVIGGRILGVLGILLAIPVAAIISYGIRELHPEKSK